MKSFLEKVFNRVPWGIVAGAAGILCFYCALGVFGAQFVFAQVNGQTGQAATIFDTPWQIALFVFAILTFVVFAGALTLFIMKKVKNKRGGGISEKIAE